VFWVGVDGFVLSAAGHFLDGYVTVDTPVVATSNRIAAPGAALAAVQRVPGLYEVFVVGQDAVWLLANASGAWSASKIGPTTDQVATDSPIAAVATTTNNLDLFYLDASRRLQRLSWTNLLPTEWAADNSLPQVIASAGKVQISAVSRAPDNIDVVVPCNAAGLCNVSISNANTFTGMLEAKAPAISSVYWRPSGPLSIVAPSSAAIDVISASDVNTFDTSWQLGAQFWSMTPLVPVCHSDVCYNFSMSVAPSSVSFAANGHAWVYLSTTLLKDAYPINLSYNVPPGVYIADGPASVTPGQTAEINLAATLDAPGPKGPVTIVGDNEIETHLVGVDVTTTPCVPVTCVSAGFECGASGDGCGHPLDCGSCGSGFVCHDNICLRPRCSHPRPCPRGSHWEEDQCACVGD
jgi:hypothetical protein